MTRTAATGDRRAVSTTLGYVLTLSISTLLVTGLLVAGGTFVSDQRERVSQSQLSVVGDRLAGEVTAVDRMVRGPGSVERVRVVTPLPEDVAGSGYTVTVQQTGSTTYQLHLEASGADVSVAVGFVSQTPVVEETVQGGDLAVVGVDTDGDDAVDELEVRHV